MSQRMYVVAAEGRSVPMETSLGTIQSEPVAVIDSHYYRRRIAEGDLRVVDAPAAGDASPSTGAPTAPAGSPETDTAPMIDPSLSSTGTPADDNAASTETTSTHSRRRAAP